ncbi:MAG: hypothetical protein QXG58_06410 [Candidatus Bathyarchaeia archaeon]
MKEMSELANLFRDLRGDMKKLIETLAALNNHLSKLETFAESVAKLTRELEEANRNIKSLTDMFKELSK